MLLALSASAATSQQRWVAHGPTGGTIGMLEVDPTSPSTIYAGTTAGVYKSVNGGHTWLRRSNGLPPDTFITGLELAPSDPSILYLKQNNTNRLYVSTNGAGSWRALPIVDAAFTRLVVHPTRARTLYLPSFEGLLRSGDGGASWARLPGLHQPGSLAISPTQPNVMYAEDGGAVMRSVDAGATWARRSARPSNYDVFTVDPHDPATVYISVPGDGLFKSIDSGATWRLLKAQRGTASLDSLAIDPRDSRRLYVGAENDGVFRSSDGGSTWERITTGLPREYVGDLEVDPKDGSPVFIGLSHRGFYRSTDGGRHWSASNRGLIATGIPALAADPSAPTTAYAGTWRGGAWRTTDGGRHWSPRGLAGRIVFGFAFDSGNSRRIYAAADNCVFRTTNGGRRWRKVFSIPGRSVTSVALAPSAPRVVYAATFERGTFRSVNGGATWKATKLPNTTRVASFAVHPRRPNTVWFGTAKYAILKSTDGGRTWRHPNNRFTSWGEIRQIVLHPRNPRVLYAAAEQGGVLKSTDGGASWADANVGIGRTRFGPVPIYGVAIDRRRPQILYAAGWSADEVGGHVYRSTNGARSWTDITGRMTTSWTWSLALSSPGTTLYAGTTAYGVEDGGGVFTTRVR